MSSLKRLETASHIVELRLRVRLWRNKGDRIALVPTMGALHEGHLAHVRAAKAKAERVVVSIFVNPAQFAPHEDFSRYPRDIAKDRAMLEQQLTLTQPSNWAIAKGEEAIEANGIVEAWLTFETNVARGFGHVRLKDGRDDGSFLPERLIQAGFRLKAFKEKEVNIEDVFMRITKGITS